MPVLQLVLCNCILQCALIVLPLKSHRNVRLSSPPLCNHLSALDLNSRLQSFELVSLSESPDSIDTAFADQFLKVFTRMAKAQWKTQQKASLSARKVAEHLDEHGDLLDDLKRQRATLDDRNEQLQRVLLEVVDLVTGFRQTANASDNAEMQGAAETMQQALDASMQKIGLQPIPALGEVPDALYHFVLDTTSAERDSEQGRIVEVVQPGYTLYGDVLRKANVIVAK
jgi:molecular chaperone GrpE (heat shock protein)